jgi:hypothetical protein
MTEAQLRQQRVDGADLHTLTAAMIAQLRGIDMVAAIGHQERQSRKPLKDRIAGSRTGKSLQEFLQYEPGRE